MKWWDQVPWSSFSEFWILSQPVLKIWQFRYAAVTNFSWCCIKNLRGNVYYTAVLECHLGTPESPWDHFRRSLGVKAIFKIMQRCYLFSSVQSLSCVRLLVTPWIAAHQASLSITNTWSSLKLTSIESVMPSSHLILCCPLLLLPQSLPASRSFKWVNSSHEVAKVLELQL